MTLFYEILKDRVIKYSVIATIVLGANFCNEDFNYNSNLENITNGLKDYIFLSDQKVYQYLMDDNK